MPLHISARAEAWPLKEAFTISRGSKIEAHVVEVTITDGKHTGRGESVPYARYGETVEGVLAQIQAAAPKIKSKDDVASVLKAGAARNALDCAFWDLEAKRQGVAAHTLLGVDAPEPTITAYTISLGSPEEMAAKARSVPHLPLLKLKLGGPGDDDRMRAVRIARPDARLIVDANEAWPVELLQDLIDIATACNIEAIEQPLPASADSALRGQKSAVPICADESVHTAEDLPRIARRYDAVNIKLDKAGGLTAALAMVQAAESLGLEIMIGSMVGTSLAVAPAMLIAPFARWIDLDGPLLLAKDRDPPLKIESGLVYPPEAALWG